MSSSTIFIQQWEYKAFVLKSSKFNCPLTKMKFCVSIKYLVYKLRHVVHSVGQSLLIE
jgi:hypothetical protein